MKYTYLVYYCYDNCEDAYIDGVFTSLDAAQLAWEKGAIDFLSQSPDDVSEYNLIKMPKDEALMTCLSGDLTQIKPSWIEQNIANNMTVQVLHSVCGDDLHRIAKIYGKEHKIDDLQKVFQIFANNKDEFATAATKVLN